MSRAAPLLLDALDYFPAPPTFIPASPIGPSPIGSRFNPPPSLPPSAPLPPVPSGPSRISETDTLLLLNTAGPARSRSKLSLREHRDSVASTRSSVSTRSSPQTPSSAAQSLHRPSLTFSIDENDLLDDAPVFPKDDGLEDIRVPVPPLAAARRTPPRTTTPHRESIALTSVAIPAPDSDTEPDFDALPDSRAPSPDIATILAKTPRPRLASLSHRPPNDAPWEEDFIDDYGRVSSSVYSNDSTYAFGYPDPNGPDARASTAIQLMLHHGFLSPHSKLLPHSAESLAPSPVPSPASSLFPRTDLLPRDTRDTPKRRVRHRDGKTLRGGIGLTTGLGWSDSEDEDAPSALTRRISSLNLNQSASKLGLSRSSSLSHSARASTFSAARTSTFSSPAQPAALLFPPRPAPLTFPLQPAPLPFPPPRPRAAAVPRASTTIRTSMSLARGNRAKRARRQRAGHVGATPLQERSEHVEPAAHAYPQSRDARRRKAAASHAEPPTEPQYGQHRRNIASKLALGDPCARGDGPERPADAAYARTAATIDAEHTASGPPAVVVFLIFVVFSGAACGAPAARIGAEETADAPAAPAAAPSRARWRPRAGTGPLGSARRVWDLREHNRVQPFKLRVLYVDAERVDVSDVRVATLAIPVCKRPVVPGAGHAVAVCKGAAVAWVCAADPDDAVDSGVRECRTTAATDGHGDGIPLVDVWRPRARACASAAARALAG
ncbi:hypothetical protein B0H13DRAFT_1914234 [Mycena leptocephala]|nr:hypothetical protein B0H13DRAFT_1914234 [Mycena leptocephala]